MSHPFDEMPHTIAETQRLRIHDLEEELAGAERARDEAQMEFADALRHRDDLQASLDQTLDLVEWLKHAMSEQAWHFRATVGALELQYRHDVKRGVAKQRSTVVFGDVETVIGHGYADGQVT